MTTGPRMVYMRQDDIVVMYWADGTTSCYVPSKNLERATDVIQALVGCSACQGQDVRHTCNVDDARDWLRERG